MSNEFLAPTDGAIPRPVVNREIASTGDGRDITRAFTGELLLPYDRILSGRGGNDLLIYELVRSDPQVHAMLEQRRNAVIQAPWQVEAASDSAIDKEAAAFLETQLKAIGWDRVTGLMLFGNFYGFSVGELLWDVQGNRLGWKGVKVRNRRRFRFGKDHDLRLITARNLYPGEEAGPPNFWHFATGADHDDEPYGLGLAHWLYWPVLFKRNGIKFWLTFLEKFAGPTGVGKYDANSTKEEREKLLAATRAMQVDSGIIIPKEMQIELLEAARSGTGDYKTLHDTMDETIAKVVLGQTMTSQDGSSEAQANVHMDVRQDLVKADSDLVCESFNLGPVRWLMQFNFPNAGLPRVYRMLEAEADLDEKADTDTKIQALGFKPSLAYVQETYGAHWELRPVTTAPTPSMAGAIIEPDLTARVEFSDPGNMLDAARAENAANQQLLVDGAAALAEGWREFVGPRVAELTALLDETGDLKLFGERLVEMAAADRAPNPAFVTALERAGFGAQLLGRVPKVEA